MGEQENEQWGLVMPFWMDTDAYTARDRDMFTAGYEFCMVYELLQGGWRGNRPIHRENESRIRMMCGKLGVPCEIRQHEGYEGCETWSNLITTPPTPEADDEQGE